MDILTIAALCTMLPSADQHNCNRILTPPSIMEACWSVTNYWPFDGDGELQPWGGQADSDPYHTANGTELSLDLEWQIAAGPLPLVGNTFVFPNDWRLSIADTFGADLYQQGVFWHYHYMSWVIGVDVLTPQPIHHLECGGRIE